MNIKTMLAAGTAFCLISSAAYADYDYADNTHDRGYIIRTNADSVQGNDHSASSVEGFLVRDGASGTDTIFSSENNTNIQSSNGNSMRVSNGSGVQLNGGSQGTSVVGNGGFSASGGTAALNTNTNANTNINSGTSNGTVSIGNANSTTNVLGSTYINTSGSSGTNIGTGTYTGTVSVGNANSTTNVTGTTNVNTTGNRNTIIGNSASSTAITGTTYINNSGSGATNIGNAQSSTNITGTTNINGTGSAAINVGTHSYSGTMSIGNADSTTNMLGATTINSSGSADTSIGSGDNTTDLRSATNNIGVSSDYATTNNIGTNAAFSSSNTIGNSHVGSTSALRGGNSRVAVQNGSASIASGGNGYNTYSSAQTVGSDYVLVNGNAASQNLVNGASVANIIQGDTLVDGNMYINGTLVYSSNTSASTTVTDSATGAAGGMNVVNSGQNGYVSDANGKITAQAATETTASLTVTNPQGNTHGLVVGQSATTLTGGANSSSMILNDNGARFSNSVTGAPIKVTGVADGTSNFDAVNYRQLKSVAAGVAGVSAMSNIPQVDRDKSFNLGFGVGNFQSQTAVAFGASARLDEDMVARASVATDFGANSTAIGAGVGWSW